MILLKEQYFLFRFGIIHCVADSGVYGMLVKKPEGVEWKTMIGFK